ncbi:MAG: hypothetical protein IPP05_18550 [Cytophagaceae bacterium]|nr:hypothetical protein [Cytophagaceae bacterium]MBL0304045.1 hypothetical protein [Cytophagaceae bacterium]
MSIIKRCFLLTFFTLWQYSCIPIEDLPPFDITVTLLPNGTSARLDWPLVNDPQIGTVRYDVYLGTTRVATNINANTYTFNNLEYNTAYTGKLVGKTLSGDEEEATYSFSTLKEYILVPDPGLEQSLIDAGYDTEGIINQKMYKEDAPLVKKLEARQRNISNLTGISHFTNLEYLDLSINQISQIDLTQNTKLTYLNLGQNLLTNVNLSPNVLLKNLIIHNNSIQQLNITQSVLLEVLVANYNQLSAIDINRNNLLITLGLNNNNLNQVNFSGNARLTEIDLSNNPISGLSLSNLTLLKNLAVQNASLSGLNTGSLTNLVHLDVSGNVITSLDIRNNTLIETLDVSFNRLTKLNIKNNVNLIALNTKNNNNLSQICVTNAVQAQDNFDWIKDDFTIYNTNCN